MNGGRLKHLSIWACLILSKNGDRVAFRRAWLIASIAALWCLCRLGEINNRSTNSCNLSLNRWEPLWWENSPRLSLVLPKSLGDSPRFLLWHLPRISNFKSLTCLCKHSNSWSLLSYCLCSECRTLIDTTVRTLLSSPADPHALCTYSLDPFLASFLTNSSPWTNPQIGYLRNSSNVGQPYFKATNFTQNYN